MVLFFIISTSNYLINSCTGGRNTKYQTIANTANVGVNSSGHFKINIKQMKYLSTLITLIVLPIFLFAQNDLEERSLLDNKIKMLVPKSFHVMTDEEYKVKYPNPKRKASLILTDKNLEVNLVIDHLTQYDLTNEQVEEFKNMQLAAVQKSHPEGKLIDNGMKTINGKNVGVFKILTQASDQKIFNYFIFTNLDHKVLLMTFNCGENLKTTWEGVIDKMVLSIKLSN